MTPSLVHIVSVLKGVLLGVGLWLFVTTATGVMSGWLYLQAAYPDRDEPELWSIGMISGRMGLGTRFTGMLSLAACETGLRVRVWWIFGPLMRPFFVPWTDIDASPNGGLLTPQVLLKFGRPEIGRLRISSDLWTTVMAAVDSHRPGKLE